MNQINRFLLFCLVLTSSIWLFNACSGAASKRAEILRSINTELEVATVAEEKVEEVINDTSEAETEAEPDDPEEFNYFPYDLQLDTIAYMGCENASSFFTVKAGAYFSRSGLRLSEYFLQRKSSMSQSALKALIESSTKHRAIPYLSIAHKHNLTAVLSFSGKAIKQFSMLNLPRLTDDVINSGNTRLREPNGDTIEAKFSYGLGGATTITKAFHQNWKLLLSYKGGKEGKTLHKTDGDWGIDVYGRVYSISLDKVESASGGLSRYALNSVSEEKRPEAPPQRDWVCPSSLRFEIRRHPENAYNAQKYYNQQDSNYKKKFPSLSEALNADDPALRIPPDEPLCVSSSSSSAAHTVAKKVLGNNWNININSKCIALKDPDDYCYEITRQNNLTYRLAQAGSDCGAQKNNYCPHFLSICIRKN